MSEEFDAVLNSKENKTIFHVPGVLSDKKDFEGPLDLLLYLISKNDANVYDIPVALITEQFIQYINENKTEIGDLTDFYRLAAELIYIKTKMLLPEESELDEDYEDPRKDLVDRLIDYQKFKKYTDLLIGADTDGRIHIDRGENLFSLPFEDEDLFKDVTISDILNTFNQILAQTPPTKIFNIYQAVSINEKRALLLELLEDKEEILITDLVVDFSNPLHIICAFMAILEAAKDKTILFRQNEPYGPIYITRRPDEWSTLDPDEIDKEADIIEKNNLEDPEDYTILNDEALMNLDSLIHKKEEEKKEDIEYIGDEEDINLDEDDE